ncbi:MAG: TonB-dependent receptor [Ignavibacteria bacterium]|nr:TonB-dependent receptor [Ignavibacteria bacterium]
MKNTLLSLAILLFLAGSVTAQSGNGIIRGKVIDGETKAPLEGAVAELLETKQKTGTDANGEVVFDRLSESTYRIRVTYIGYEPIIKNDLVLYAGRPLETVIEISPSSITTGEIDVSASYFEKNSDVSTSMINLDYEEIRRAPGAAEDISRMVQAVSGVSFSNDQRNDLIIRGGSPAENLFLIDGIEIPNINHFGSQGSTGGPIGILNLKFLQNADIYTGGFPVTYGNALSGAVDISFREGSKKYYYNNIDMSLQGFGGQFEGRFSDKSSYLVSLRRSYLDLLKDAIRLSAVPKYWDMNFKSNIILNEKNSISLLGFWATDKIEFGARDEDDETANPFENAKVDRQFYTAGLNHTYLIRNGFIRNVLSGVVTDGNTTQYNESNTAEIYKNDYVESEVTLKSDLSKNLSEYFSIDAGIGGKLVRSDNDLYSEQDTSATGYVIPEVNTNSLINSFKLNGYVNLTTRLFNDRLVINSGLRYDYFDYITNPGSFSPRIGVSYKVTPVTSINASAGIFHQNPAYIWLATVESNRNLDNIRADHYVFGIDHLISEDLRVTAEVYEKQYSNYAVSTDNPTYILVNGGAEYGPNYVTAAVSAGTGTVRGFDLSLQKKLSGNGIYGMLNYSYMNSKFKALEGGEVPGAFDQTHQLNLTLGYQVADDWLVGLKYKFSTGKPYTPYDAEASIAAGRGVYDMALYNSERTPDYMRVDLRVDKKFSFSGIGLVTYIEFQNLLNRENVSEYYWDDDKNEVGEILHWGFFPVGGFSLQF